MEDNLEGMTPEQIASLALLAKNLASNPNTRNDFLGLTKKANPELSIPEVDLPAQVRAEIREESKKREELEKKILEQEVRNRVLEERARISKEKKLSDSDIAEVEKLMTEKGITSHDTAAEFYLAQKRSAVPTPSSFASNVHTLPKPDLKPFNGNLNQWARDTAANTIDMIRKGQIVV